MKWKQIRRGSGLVEHVCIHHVGHPDPESAKRIADMYGHDPSVWSTHGCDGCCSRPDFPGRLKPKHPRYVKK